MLEIEIKPNLLDRKRKLIISADFIEYDDTDWVDVPATKYLRDEIMAFRFGIEPIKGYMFTIGWRYTFEIKGLTDKVMEIRFTTLYGIRKKELGKKYTDIVTAFLDLYQDDLVNRYIHLFNAKLEVEILETLFTDDFVSLNNHKISYEYLGIKEYSSYYALYSKRIPKIYKSYSYLKDWNAIVVYGLAKQLLISKGFLS